MKGKEIQALIDNYSTSNFYNYPNPKRATKSKSKIETKISMYE